MGGCGRVVGGRFTGASVCGVRVGTLPPLGLAVGVARGTGGASDGPGSVRVVGTPVPLPLPVFVELGAGPGGRVSGGVVVGEGASVGPGRGRGLAPALPLPVFVPPGMGTG